MRILICGASGFIGGHLEQTLTARGHDCIRAVRTTHGPNDRQIDYLDATSIDYWRPRLEGIDAVIDAIGVLRDTRKTPMQRLHAEAPTALFKACVECGVPRIVNISALGVDRGLDTTYFRTKRTAEATLFALPDTVRWLNLRPSIVYGPDGAGARMFRLMASLPVHMLPMGGRQRMQPVHVDDLAAAVGNWLEDGEAANLTVEAVGNEAVTMREMLDAYRQQMDKGGALHIPVPGFCVRLAAWCGDYIPASPLCRDNLAMLELGSTAAPGSLDTFTGLLGREPLGVSRFLTADAARKGRDG